MSILNCVFLGVDGIKFLCQWVIYERRVGQYALACMRQTMVSRSITIVTHILSTHMLDRYVFFPETEEQQDAVKER